MLVQIAISKSEAFVIVTSSQESTNQKPAIQPKITNTDELIKLQTKTLEKLAQIKDRL